MCVCVYVCMYACMQAVYYICIYKVNPWAHELRYFARTATWLINHPGGMWPPTLMAIETWGNDFSNHVFLGTCFFWIGILLILLLIFRTYPPVNQHSYGKSHKITMFMLINHRTKWAIYTLAM